METGKSLYQRLGGYDAICHDLLPRLMSDRCSALGHLNTTLATFEVPAAERAEVLGFVDSTKADIVET